MGEQSYHEALLKLVLVPTLSGDQIGGKAKREGNGSDGDEKSDVM